MSILFFHSQSYSQSITGSDSLIRTLLTESHLTDMNDQGVTLIKNANYTAANSYFSNEIKKDESDKSAYYNRGIVNWALQDVANACRDWSAVLALGDTATFLLLEKNCHGNMIIEDDTIPSARYKKMFGTQRKDNKVLSSQADAKTIVEEMPAFPGGEEALFIYLSSNVKYPSAAREKKVEGTVYVNFIVSRKGKVLFPYVQRGISKECDAEALRVIKNMPLWKPGKQNGKPVLVRHSLPVKFRIR